MPKGKAKKNLVENGFPQAFLDDMAITLKAAISGKDAEALGPLLEKLGNSEIHRFPKMAALLDQYVGELTGVDVVAMRNAATGLLEQGDGAGVEQKVKSNNDSN